MANVIEWIDGVANLREEVAGDRPPAKTAEEMRNLMPPLSRLQLFIGMAESGLLTPTEAESAAAGEAIPAAFVALIGMLPEASRPIARMRFRAFTVASRVDPLVVAFAATSTPEITPEAMDTYWSEWGML